MAGNETPILELRNVTIGYETEAGTLEAVRDVSLTIGRNESFGLVGESGSGKTTLAMGAIRYLAGNGRIVSGQVLLNGEDITAMDEDELRRIWGGRVTMVYQNPGTALNPSITIGKQLSEVVRIHQGKGKKEAMQDTLAMLEKVAMPNPEGVARQYPHQLSGGMLQRCIIAMALLTNPDLLIMDEPTTALDVTTQAVVLDLVAELKKEFDSAILFITHDLAVAAMICDYIGVMYAGAMMETGELHTMFKNPLHPYTLKLLGCIPHFERQKEKRALGNIPGFIPRLDELPSGCVFHPRCSLRDEECSMRDICLADVGDGHCTSCFRWEKISSLREEIKDEKVFPSPDKETVEKILYTENVKKDFPVVEAFFNIKKSNSVVKAVDDITLWVNDGSTLGVVGESGCGKTTLARSIIGLIERTSGSIQLEGKELRATTAQRSRDVLKALQMVFQNPEASLNPRRTVADAISRPMSLLTDVKRKDIPKKVLELLDSVNLPSSYYHRLPDELSGGEKQRVAVARAFAAEPQLILLDEPLSSLDVSVQASLINLLFNLQEERGTSYLFISHDLATVQHLSDWLAVMYLGKIIEWGSADEVFNPPMHPYTEALLSAIPVPDPDVQRESIRLEGSVPSAAAVPSGCRFHTRCPRKYGEICETEEPPWQEGGGDNCFACHIPVEELKPLQQKTVGEV
jgi:peptide/nickel transport system ATP-binding protein